MNEAERLRRELARACEERDGLFDLSSEAAGIIGADGLFERQNPNWKGLLGFSPEEFASRPAIEFICHEDRALILGLLRGLEPGETASLENRFLCKDGSYKRLEWKARALADTRAYLVLLREAPVQRREEIDEALRESIQRMSEIIDFLPDATFAINTEGVVIMWNRAIEEMTGVQAKSIVGKGGYEYALPLLRRAPTDIDRPGVQREGRDREKLSSGRDKGRYPHGRG